MQYKITDVSKNDKYVNEFIERYAKDTRIKIYELNTRNSKINKANAFYNILNEYSDNLPTQCITKIKEITEELKVIANQSTE